MENLKTPEQLRAKGECISAGLRAKKAFKDTMFDLYSNIGLVLGFIVFMFTLGVIIGFVTYSVVGVKQMLDKINKTFPKAKKGPIKQDNIVA